MTDMKTKVCDLCSRLIDRRRWDWHNPKPAGRLDTPTELHEVL